MSELKTKQEFCCWHWKQLIEGKALKTKQEAFDNGKHPSMDPEFYNIHPNFIMWVNDDEHINNSGWHWYHFCPNCGAQKDPDENIRKWRNYWLIVGHPTTS